jgi:hypothetical protein
VRRRLVREPERREEHSMYAVCRRYESVDTSRADEVSRSIKDEFVPMISDMAGYHGYWVVQSGNVFITFGLFETRDDADESTRMASAFIRDQNLQDALPNPPQVTAGEVTVAGAVHALA